MRQDTQLEHENDDSMSVDDMHHAPWMNAAANRVLTVTAIEWMLAVTTWIRWSTGQPTGQPSSQPLLSFGISFSLICQLGLHWQCPCRRHSRILIIHGRSTNSIYKIQFIYIYEFHVRCRAPSITNLLVFHPI